MAIASKLSIVTTRLHHLSNVAINNRAIFRCLKSELTTHIATRRSESETYFYLDITTAFLDVIKEFMEFVEWEIRNEAVLLRHALEKSSLTVSCRLLCDQQNYVFKIISICCEEIEEEFLLMNLRYTGQGSLGSTVFELSRGGPLHFRQYKYSRNESVMSFVVHRGVDRIGSTQLLHLSR